MPALQMPEFRPTIKGSLFDPAYLASFKQEKHKPKQEPWTKAQIAAFMGKTEKQLIEEQHQRAIAQEQAKEAAKQHRIEICGMPHITGDGITGDKKDGTYICGYWDECPHCYQRRLKLMYKRYKEAVEACQQPVAVRLDSEAMRDLRDRLRLTREDYRNFPTPEDDVMILDAAKWDIGDIQTVPLDDLSMNELTETPKSRRPSGSLGYSPEVVAEGTPDDPIITVSVPKVIAEAGAGHCLDEAWLAALEATAHFTPELSIETLEDDIGYLEWCLMRRWVDAYKDAVEAQGGVVLHISTCRQRFRFSSYLGWGEQIQTILDKYRKRITSQALREASWPPSEA